MRVSALLSKAGHPMIGWVSIPMLLGGDMSSGKFTLFFEGRFTFVLEQEAEESTQSL